MTQINKQILNDMKNTEQTKGLSVLEHGFMVKNYTFDLINHLKGLDTKYNWSKLPSIIIDNKELFLDNLLPKDIIKEYTILHDIGKAYCISDGIKKFPNHEIISHKIYSNLTNSNDDVAYLILHDMDIHLAKGKLITFDNKFIYTQIIVSVAEVFANSQMFGGFQSTSFIIKNKQIQKTISHIIKNKK